MAAVSALDELGHRLERFLRQQLPGREVTVTDLRRLTGGASRHTYRYTVRDDRTTADHVLRCDPPPRERLQETDRRTEWAILSAVAQRTDVPVATPHFFADDWVTGHPGFICEAVNGDPLVSAIQDADPAGRLALADDVCDILAGIHGVDLAVLSAAVPSPASWDAYMTQVLDDFAATATALSETPQPFVRHVVAWLDAHRPRPAPLALLHGDFQPGNMLVDPTGRITVLDWEWARIGDPREDIAFSSFLAETYPPDVVGLDRERFMSRYCGRTGFDRVLFDEPSMDFFTIFGGLRIYAGILRAILRAEHADDIPVDVAWVMNWLPYMHGRWAQIIESRTTTGASS